MESVLADSELPPRRMVMIVDDEALVRRTAATMIGDAGYETIQAANADEAIALLKACKDIFLVFTDVEMPGCFDGSKLAAYVAGLWPPVRVIVTSGRVEGDAVPMADGVTFLPKPYREDELIERVAELAD
jgi:CheY-like chemotaxis protein